MCIRSCVYSLLRCYAVTRLLAGILYTTFTRSCMYSLLRCYELTGRNSVHYFHSFLYVFAVTLLRGYWPEFCTLILSRFLVCIRCYGVTKLLAGILYTTFTRFRVYSLLRCYAVTKLRCYEVFFKNRASGQHVCELLKL